MEMLARLQLLHGGVYDQHTRDTLHEPWLSLPLTAAL